MFPSKKSALAVSILTIIVLVVPSLGAEETNRAPVTTRFLSWRGEVLPVDWRAARGVSTFFVVHGFQGSGTQTECLRQAAAVVRRFPQANAIIVEWCPPPPLDVPAKNAGGSLLGQLLGESLWAMCGKWVNTPSEYARWAKCAKDAGRDIAAWMAEKRIAPADTVICGHSLGAQVAAFASNETARPERFGQPVRAILAADPAGPLFSAQDPAERLDKADAQNVVVVHTTDLFGDTHAIGTADIYVTWPASQEESPDQVWRHSQARELLTTSFLRPDMSNTDGTPFGANALGYAFPAPATRTFQAERPAPTDLAIGTAASAGL